MNIENHKTYKYDKFENDETILSSKNFCTEG